MLFEKNKRPMKKESKIVFPSWFLPLRFLNPILHGGGGHCARIHRQLLKTPWQMPQMSSDFMNLFFSNLLMVLLRPFFKKRFGNFEKLKKIIFCLKFLGKNREFSKNFGFFFKNHSWTWIYIVHVLSFLLRYITCVLLKIFRFLFLFSYKISMEDHFPSTTSSDKNNDQRRLVLISMDS